MLTDFMYMLIHRIKNINIHTFKMLIVVFSESWQRWWRFMIEDVLFTLISVIFDFFFLNKYAFPQKPREGHILIQNK